MNQKNTLTAGSAPAWRDSPASFPVSFTYRGTAYRGFAPEVFKEETRKVTPGNGRETTEITFAFDGTMRAYWKQTLYPAYGFSEWTVSFENLGKENSGVIADLGADCTFPEERATLKGILGDLGNQYRPYEKPIAADAEPVSFISDTGRATHIHFPYFNLEHGNGGTFLAIGWAGTWTADFCSENGKVHYRARAVNNLNTYLKPGERIRSALFVFGNYVGLDDAGETNFWRHWFIDCNMPRANAAGDPIKPFSTCCLANDTGLPNSDGSISERSTTWKPTLDMMIAEDCKVDFRWLDAGWYSAPNGDYTESDWWGTIGSWEPDRTKWPGHTLRNSTDYAREHGMKTLMWFEPERVTDPASLAKNYGYHTEWGIHPEGSGVITNNIGNPDCLRWTTERVTKVLRENRVEMYREDNNSNPAPLWAYLDGKEGENRQGITECRMVAGHYQMWDDIIACTAGFGGCAFVDSCASGGGRNDIESMRRGVPLLRSDSDRTTTALRLSMTTSFNRWIPFCGANSKEKVGQVDPTGRSDVYIWRASYLPSLNVDSQFTQDPNQDFSVLRRGLAEWKKVSPYLLDDYYVLTPWHDQTQKDSFTAYAFYDPKTEKGVLLLFRMEDCEESTLTVRLPFAADGDWLLTDEDSKKTETVSGSVLQSGYVLSLPEKRTARLLWIEKKK